MTTIIINESRTDSRIHLEIACGKKQAFVSFNFERGHLDVCCYNASHKAWGGMGKAFTSFSAAREHYKTAEMLAILDAAEDIAKPTPSNVIPFLAAA